MKDMTYTSRTASKNGKKRGKNQYDFVSGSVIAETLEKTQINKFHTKGGTGFAAEEVNALNDRLRGHNIEQVGVDNAKNGADRVVNGVSIQTKYFATPWQTVDAAFEAKGSYRYSGQQLEVPKDQYDDCLKLMREKISEGKVPGVTNPEEAESIIKKGDVTYKQARNIAKAGNIDGLLFDAKSQCVTSGYVFAISFAINFSKIKWSGRSTKEAISDSISMALQSGTASFVTGIATAQVLRTRAAAIGVVFMRDGVRSIAQTQVGKGLVEKVAQASLGKAVYGAAATNHVAKLLRTNVVTSVVTTVVISTPDFYRACFSGSISWAQFAKNLTVNGAGIAGGAGGWMAGAAAGAAVGSAFPGPGTAIGGVIGGVLGAVAGGSAATVTSKYILDGLIEDDAKEMIRILPSCLEPLATDYMLSEPEVQDFATQLKDKVTPDFLRDMYKSKDRHSFVYNTFEPICGGIIEKRPKIKLPTVKQVRQAIDEITDAALETKIA